MLSIELSRSLMSRLYWSRKRIDDSMTMFVDFITGRVVEVAAVVDAVAAELAAVPLTWF